jgi:exonuclease III
MSSIKLTFWNIQGLPRKCDRRNVFSDMFSSAIRNFDIIGLTESWYNDEDVNNTSTNIEVAGYKRFTSGRKLRHSKGHGSPRGGVVVYYRAEFDKSISVMKSNHGDQLWIKLDRDYFGLERDLFIATVYIAPANSPISTKRDFDPFDVLKSDIMRYSQMGDVMLAGDFNARTGRISDCPIWNESDERHCPLNDVYEPGMMFEKLGIPKSRCSMDSTVNGFGKSLLDLCTATNLCILNGRTLGDMRGRLSSYSYQGSSVVDYTIISPILYDKVVSFQICPLSPLSDHCQISVCLRVENSVATGNQTTKHNIRRQPTRYYGIQNLREIFKMSYRLRR